ncbi:MAG TPA: MopE-related protein [Polyangiaceae bacterium LLY-WYZ-14_1]|nr:MopE-related protein [Polyangiaceae bacterium LLY-WYZ-14_1]
MAFGVGMLAWGGFGLGPPGLGLSGAQAQTLTIDGSAADPADRERSLGGLVDDYDTVRVINGGVLRVLPFDGTDRVNTGNLVVVAETIEVDASSRVDARGAGYFAPRCGDGGAPASFPTAGGAGGCSLRDSGGGGAHFGRGGRGTKDDPVDFPDDFEEDCGNTLNAAGTSCTSTANCRNGDGEPSVAGEAFFHSIYEVEFGAAGGDKGCRDGDGFGSQPAVGGPGGGRVVLVGLNASGGGSVTFDGTLDAAGRRGCGTGNDSAGGGAGGSVLLVGNTVTIGADADLSVAGGLGGDTFAAAIGEPDFTDCPPGAQTGGTCDDCGGGGGGGIITVLSNTSDLSPEARFTVAGALGGVCDICRGEAGGGAGELQLDGAYVGEFCDGFDNDFDGSVDEGLGTRTCGLGSCARTIDNCSGGVPVTCVPDVDADDCEAPFTDARPRVAVVLDTSASMLLDLEGFPTFGDGSDDQAGIDLDGDGDPNDSRLFLAREAVGQLVSAYPEIDFALARYHQDTGEDRSCQAAAWFECQDLIASYDDPTNNTGDVLCTVQTGPDVGDTETVRVNPNGDECINYAGSCGPPRRGADILSGFGTPARDLVRWLDGAETDFRADATIGDYCAHSAGGDCEVRATGPTPIAGSLQAIEDYVVPIRGTDPALDCRTYSVILVTDGAESCGGDPAAAARRLFDTYGIETFVVAVSVLDSEEASLNEIARAGSGDLRDATFVENPEDLLPTLTEIVAGSIRFEECNGVDDDCDGEVDEDFPLLGTGCDDGEVGICRGVGAFVCNDDGDDVRCQIDMAGGTPETEVCNDLDDNCNGQVDEGLVCTGSCVPSGPEICDGVDNDCNNLVDEAGPGIGEVCGETLGQCEPGAQRCVAGMLQCVGGVGPRDEVCNGLDDDCDGEADELAVCPEGSACIEGGCRRSCRPSQEFPCPFGLECVTGDSGESFCVPTPCAACESGELCIDDVCVDVCEDVTCGPGERCVEGNCLSCVFTGCPGEQVCFAGACQDDPCAEVDCPDGEACEDGRCEPLCDPAACEDGEVCGSDGRCVATGCPGECPEGQFCQAGRCESDPCSAGISCAAGQVCVAEAGCVDDPCPLVDCPEGSFCQVAADGGAFCVAAGGDDDDDGGPGERFVVAGGGVDRSCAVGGRPGPQAAGLGLGVLLALGGVFRRRRRLGRGGWLPLLPFVAAASLPGVLGGCEVDAYCVSCQDGGPNAGDDDDDDDDDTVGDDDDLMAGDDDDDGPCIPTSDEEICNGLDDDCNGEIDETFDFETSQLHCGVCNNVCRAPNAEQECRSGECVVLSCLPGFEDLDDEPGCEYACPVFPTQAEDCNGFDDDCDGLVDEPEELPAPPDALCRNTPDTPCQGVVPVCDVRDGVPGWYCDYPETVEFDPLVPNGIVLEESRCDGIDGDCDGVPDEVYEDLGEACDDGELGACRNQGRIACDPDDAFATLCDFSLGPDPVADSPNPEVCNGVDDDCDGVADNATGPGRVIDEMVHVDFGGFDFWVYAYESSRPDATDEDAGTSNVRACSRSDVLPWASISQTAAAAACAAAGKRLCTGAEWQAACEGMAGQTYPYGATYAATSCNGADNDTDPGVPVTTELLATGSLATCESPEGAFDLSGNLKEWTDDSRGVTADGDAIHVTRGGSLESPRLGLTCQTDLSRAALNTVLPTIGFRCCSDTAP